ncbi:MAG: hypothetical protein LBC02_08935 [Planctomycetaceae bacterium]|jgi:hypothetical protein|nr:hypothetical protein [Planctomycetaceae bacterium]
MFRVFYYSLLILSICFVVDSCRRLPPSPEGLPKLYPCKVSVTFGGEKIEGVTVSLVSKDPNFKWKSGGKTDKNGVAELRTSFAYPGAPEGIFTIAFFKIKDPPGGNTLEAMTPISLIPLKYSADQSKETVEIKSGKNEFSFTLEGGEERLPLPQGNIQIKR